MARKLIWGGVRRSRRELIESVIEWRGRALSRLIETGAHRKGEGRKKADRIKAELDELREKLAAAKAEEASGS